MRVLQRAAAVPILAAIAYLGAACERAEMPTGARPPAAALLLSNDPTTRWVNDDDPNGGGYAPPGTSCNNPGYPTVQMAVDAPAAPGDRINVCPGTYVEQVTIPAGKDNIQLRSTRRWEAVIKAPAAMVPPQAIVRVNGAQDVTILAFTITGPSNTLDYGVRVDGGGSADILGNHITQIRDDPLSGDQSGVAVQVGREAELTTGSARIMGNVIDNYQKNGPTVDNAGSYAEIVNNRVLGIGPTAVTAQNGIQVSRGATADVRHNFVSGNIYMGPIYTASGVLLYSAGTASIDHNTTARSDDDIYAFLSATDALTSVTHNRVRASTFDGIVVDLYNNATVRENHTEQNGGAGIGLYEGAANNTIEDNQVERNSNNFNSTTCTIIFPVPPLCFGGGILLYDASNNILRYNHIRNNGTLNNLDNTDGIRVNTPSTANTIRGNHLRDNVTHDCHDATTPGSNTWADNRGETSSPPQLCGEDRDDNDEVEAGWDPAYPWYDAFGIAAAEYDFAAAYAMIDTESLLQLLPQIRLAGIRRATPSPNQ